MVLKKKEAPFQPSGETTRIKSLGGGTYAYVFDALGKTHHLKRDSTELVELCASLNEAFKGKIVQELKVMGWDDVATQVESFENTESS